MDLSIRGRKLRLSGGVQGHTKPSGNQMQHVPKEINTMPQRNAYNGIIKKIGLLGEGER